MSLCIRAWPTLRMLNVLSVLHSALVYQLYVNKDRAESEKILRKLEDPNSGMRAVLLTVDAPVMGNREGDQRAKGEAIETGGGHGGDAGQGKGVASAVSGYIDPNLVSKSEVIRACKFHRLTLSYFLQTWDIVGWYKQNCKLPLLLKGVQSVEDVALAKEHGCAGVILSNHGGRSLDYAPAPIDVLVELYQTRPDLIRDLDIYVDGGVRRGTDVLKALALGAKGVGLGRPFLVSITVSLWLSLLHSANTSLAPAVCAIRLWPGWCTTRHSDSP